MPKDLKVSVLYLDTCICLLTAGFRVEGLGLRASDGKTWVILLQSGG